MNRHVSPAIVDTLIQKVSGIRTDIDAMSTGVHVVGTWSAASGSFPVRRPDGSPVQAGDTWYVAPGGTVNGILFGAGDVLTALTAGGGATYAGNWVRRNGTATSAAQVATTKAGVTVQGALDQLVKQAAVDDTTAGRLLTVGAFGLGVGFNYTDDLDLVPMGGFGNDGVNSPPSNNPEGVVGGRFAGFTFGSGNAKLQIAARVDVRASALYRRTANTGQLSPTWCMLYDQNSAVRGVSQSGGTPTGGLIERGANANGEYVRYADGTQMCWKYRAVDATDMPAKTGAWVSWDYPASFVGTPATMFSTEIPGGEAHMVNAALDGGIPVLMRSLTARCVIAYANPRSNTQTLRVDALALGRWF